MNTTINNSTNFQRGVYFYRENLSPVHVWYETEYHNAISRISEEGKEYLPDFTISQKLKEKIEKIPFIQNLAKDRDTFVSYWAEKNLDYKKNGRDKFEARIDITWDDTAGGHTRRASGSSNSSLKDAVAKLLKNVTEESFWVNNVF